MKPIETAPKDGTEVLIYCATLDRFLVGWWQSGMWQQQDNRVPGHSAAIPKEWPTHWRRLPDRPARKFPTVMLTSRPGRPDLDLKISGR